MPTYEYKCSSCGEGFEAVQKITEAPGGTCPNCGSVDVKRLISASAFHLKGSGWYKTDYASSSESKGKPVTKDTKETKDSSDGKSETPTESSAPKAEVTEKAPSPVIAPSS